MGGTILTVALAGGGLLLASWVDAKVGDSRPASPMKLIGLCFVGVLLLQASAGAIYLVESSQAAIMAFVFGLFLPTLVFAMLTGLWLLRLLADIAGLARR